MGCGEAPTVIPAPEQESREAGRGMDARERGHDDGERMPARALRHAQDERVVGARSW